MHVSDYIILAERQRILINGLSTVSQLFNKQ